MKGKHEIIQVDFDGVKMFVKDFGEVGEHIDCDCGNRVRPHLWEVPTGLFSKDYFLACPQCSQYAMIPKRAAEGLRRGAGLEVLGSERVTPAELKRAYRDLKRQPHRYESSKNAAIRLTWLCGKYNPSLSAQQLVQERLEDDRLNVGQIAYWGSVSLILLFEAQEISESAREDEIIPLRAWWDPYVPPHPWESPDSWTAYKQEMKQMHEPLALALGCDVDDL